jgi:hypothetical protein
MTQSDPHLLNGWKEISTYIGRAIRTAQRWEAEWGLPVIRPAGHDRTSVVARPADIDAWLLERASHRDHIAALKERLQRLETENEELMQKNQNLETALRMVIESTQLDGTPFQPTETMDELLASPATQAA